MSEYDKGYDRGKAQAARDRQDKAYQKGFTAGYTGHTWGQALGYVWNGIGFGLIFLGGGSLVLAALKALGVL